jgi:hypothetical protein
MAGQEAVRRCLTIVEQVSDHLNWKFFHVLYRIYLVLLELTHHITK